MITIRRSALLTFASASIKKSPFAFSEDLRIVGKKGSVMDRMYSRMVSCAACPSSEVYQSLESEKDALRKVWAAGWRPKVDFNPDDYADKNWQPMLCPDHALKDQQQS